MYFVRCIFILLIPILLHNFKQSKRIFLSGGKAQHECGPTQQGHKCLENRDVETKRRQTKHFSICRYNGEKRECGWGGVGVGWSVVEECG